jgi:hypothetical protein
MPPKKKIPPGKAVASAPTVGITDSILILGYEGQSPADAKKLRTEAEQIQRKLVGKARVVTIADGEAEFGIEMNNNLNKTLEKVHIVAHGNQAQIGNYNAMPLAELLAPLLTNKNKLTRITLHTCLSASEHPVSHEIFANQLASALGPKLKNTQITKLTVRGSEGKSFTDSDGHNWVLKDDVEEIDPSKSKTAEKDWNEKNTKPRGTARPKFTISRANPTTKSFGEPFVT